MIHLELSEKEARILKEGLDRVLATESFEVARTEDREFRHELAEDETALKAIRDRLEAELQFRGVAA